VLEGQPQRHVTAERVAPDHRPGDVQRVHETDDVAGERVDRCLTQCGVEDRQARGDGTIPMTEAVEDGVPVMHLPHETVQEDHRLSGPELQPAKLRRLALRSLTSVHRNLLVGT
jgi:hypothetical protein